MHIIIDGYNVLKQMLQKTDITQMQRRAFIAMLGKYAKKKNHRIAIVFDGGDTSWPSHEKDHGITVMYSGFKYSADDLIKKQMDQKVHNLIIITSDNDIKATAASKNITTIDALEFYRLVKDEVYTKKESKKDAQLVKTSDEENPLLDSLMHQYSQVMYKPEDDQQENRRPKSHTLSKKEREYLQKIKKL